MCGFAGILDDEPNDRLALVRKMIAVQAHRGPDHTAAVQADPWFAASHARLSIVDATAAGDQPFTGHGCTLVYNGEIYNHLELRPELAKLGATFRGTSDTATLFEALRLLGVEATLRKVRGMFAFAYYTDRTLYLCRDRLGIKPLHYMRRDSALYFSSEVKGLAAAVPLALDPIRVVFSMSSVGEDSLNRTPFRKVSQVRPGTMLVVRPGCEPEEQRYYTASDDFDESYYRELDAMPADAVAARFDAMLERAVGSMMMADQTVGVFASGGVDSSVVAMIARARDEVPLFSSNVTGRYSEIDGARLLAKSLDCRLHESLFPPQRFIDEWASATWHYEVPIIRHPSALPLAAVAACARDHGMKAMLAGEGSDELFLGYPKLLTLRFDRFARQPVDALLALYGKVPGLREHLWPDPKHQPDTFINLLTQSYQRQQLRTGSIKKFGFLDESSAHEHYLTLQLLQEHLHSLLHCQDRMGMRSSIETRFPFLDEEIVRFGVSLPVKFKIRPSLRLHNYKHPFLRDKSIVRAIASKRLPQKLVQRPKNGFPVAGYRDVRIASTFFTGGYIAEVLELSRDTVEYVATNAKPDLVARLAAVDLFGRMFDLGWSVERATAHAKAHASVRD